MGLFDRFNPFRKPDVAPPEPAVEQKSGWNFLGGSASTSTSFASYSNNTGMAVSPQTSLGSAAVYACVRVLAEDCAKLPLQIRRASTANGRVSWVEETKHPLTRLLRKPNAWMTRFELISTMVTCLQLYGNAYVAIVRDGAGNPRSLIPLVPSRTTVLVAENGNLYYSSSHPLLGEEQRTLPSEDVIHVRNISVDGPMGLSPIAAAQDVIGLALATQRHAAKVYQQGTVLSGVLQHPGQLSPEAAARLADTWAKTYSGGENSFRTALLEEGTTYQTTSMSMADAQVLESRKYSAEDVARIFRVPGSKIGLMDGASFASVEQTEMSYINDALMSICRRIEEALDADLLFDNERDDVQIKFSFDSLLRGDSLVRMQVAQICLLNGIKNRNEVRAEENLGPVEGGDEFRVPLNTGNPTAPNISPMGGAPENPKEPI